MRHKRLGLLVAAIGLAALLAGSAWGGAADASLIGPARGALDLTLPFYAGARGAALGRGTVALEGGDNPAALGFFKGYDVSFGAGRVDFDHGPDLEMYTGQLIFPAPMVGGAAKMTLYGMRTHDRDASRMMGANAEVDARTLGLAYGRKLVLPIPGELAVGFAGYPYDPAHLRLKAGGSTVARAYAISQIGSIRLGTLYKATRNLNFGLQYTHIKDYAWARYPGLQIPGRTSSNYYVNIWEAGFAYDLLKNTTILAQYLFGRATGDGVDVHYSIPSCGIEHRMAITQGFRLALRGGWLDNGPTGGFGLTLPRRWRVDYACIPQFGEGVKKAFGHGPLHTLGVGKSF